MPGKQRVSAAELVRNFGYWQEKALQSPVYITHHKRDRLVLSSTEHFQKNAGGLKAEAPQIQEQPFDHNTVSAELALLEDYIVEGYVVTNEDFRILTINRVAETYFGIDRAQLVGRSLPDLFPHASGSVAAEYMRRVMRTREPATLEVGSAIFTGRHFSFRIYPHPLGMAVLFQNLTELQHLRALVTEADAAQAALQRHPQIAHAKTDMRGRITHSDDTFRLWTGFSEAELRSCRLSDIVVVGDKRRLNEAFEDVMVSHVPTTAPCRVVVKNFAEQDVLFSLAPILSDFVADGVSVIATIATQGAA